MPVPTMFAITMQVAVSSETFRALAPDELELIGQDVVGGAGAVNR